MKMIKYITLTVILLSFSFLYIATSYLGRCDDNCERLYKIDSTIRHNRDYVIFANRCFNYSQASDTLCVYVKDTSGINWNLLADTVCSVATQNGLARQKVFIIKNTLTPPDTVARKICP
jgi:hypothetical protein